MSGRERRERNATGRQDETSGENRARKRLTLLAICLTLAIAGIVWLIARPASRVAAHRVLFVGLDGADWQLLDRLMRAGKMPNLERLVREGRSGTLATIQPPLSPLVWTTMMTGVSPLEHGILDFSRFHPQTGQREPITSDERRVPAVWNMASMTGRRVTVLGLWATWPAEPLEGLMVSDRLFSFQRAEREVPAGVVFPTEREAWAREALARAERLIDVTELKRFLPLVPETEIRGALDRPDPYAHPISALRRILIETRVYHELALEALQAEDADLSIVYHQGTDTIGHVFAPYAPPRQPSISESDFRRYSGVPEVYFADVDRMLGEYRERARRAGAILMLASDHGFRWAEGRPEKLESLAAASAGRWHRDEGIWLVAGPGIAPQARVLGPASGKVGQVCSTLLALLGMAPGLGLEGPPLGGIEGPDVPAKDYREGWSPAKPMPGGGDEESMEKLQALGYIGSDEPASMTPGSNSTRTAASFNNEGLLRAAAGDNRGARAAFELALERDPNLASALWNLSDLLYREDGAEPAGPGAGERSGGSGSLKSPPGLARTDELLARAVKAGLPDGIDRTVRRAQEVRRNGQSARAEALIDAALAARPADPDLRMLRGRSRLERGECDGALADFLEVARRRPEWPLAHASAGLASLCRGDEAGARRSFERSLELDPNQPEIRRALGSPD